MKYLVIVAMPDGTTTQLEFNTPRMKLYDLYMTQHGFISFPLETGENVYLAVGRIIQITEIEG